MNHLYNTLLSCRTPRARVKPLVMAAKATAIQGLVSHLVEHPSDGKLVINACRKLLRLLDPANKDPVANPALAAAHDPMTVFINSGGLTAVVSMIRSWSSMFPDPATSGVQALCELASAALQGHPANTSFAVSCGLLEAVYSILPGDSIQEKVSAMPSLPYGVRQGVMQILSVLCAMAPEKVMTAQLALVLSLYSMRNRYVIVINRWVRCHPLCLS